MSKRRHRKSRLADKAKTDGKTLLDNTASAGNKYPEKGVANRDGPTPQPSKPTPVQKCFFAAAVALEIAWIVFLVVLAATK